MKQFKKKILLFEMLLTHVINSSSLCHKNKSWIKKWNKFTKKEPGRCIYLRCSNEATLGGHLWMKFQKSKEFYFIAPICAKCNSSTIKKKKFHEAKKNTFFLIVFLGAFTDQSLQGSLFTDSALQANCEVSICAVLSLEQMKKTRQKLDT